MREMFLPRLDGVLSGSVTGWGEELVPYFDMVVFVTAPRDIRMQRLRARFGADAVAPGGWRPSATEDFVEWASHYEADDRGGRSLAKHEAWLSGLPCPVVRVDGSRPLATLVEQLCSEAERLPA